MSNDDNSSDGKSNEVTVERDHPQTRKGESDARGSAQWNEDVIDPQEANERARQDGTGNPVGDDRRQNG